MDGIIVKKKRHLRGELRVKSYKKNESGHIIVMHKILEEV